MPITSITVEVGPRAIVYDRAQSLTSAQKTTVKTSLSLENVDNTSDADKPVSTAQATADTATQTAAATDATTKANAAQAHAIQRANHTGTQPVSTLSDPENLPVSTAAQAAIDDQDRKLSVQLNSLRKISDFSTVTATPLRIATMGDSLAALGLKARGEKMAFAGTIGGIRPVSAGSGTVNFLTDHNLAISGNYWEFEIGAERDITVGSLAGVGVVGNKACVAYLKRPSGAQFVLQSQAANETSWTTLATIDTESGDGTTYSEYQEYSIAGDDVSNILRVTSVTGDVGDTAIFNLWGIYNSNGGGVISIEDQVLTRGGSSPADFLSTPDAVFDPVFTGLAPDLIISCWNDEAANWEEGGNWDLLYDRMQAIKLQTDHIVATAYPSSTAGEETKYALARPAQKAWCDVNNHGFYDIHNLFVSWEYANSLGLMADAVHPNTLGKGVAMRALWKTTQIGRVNLGALHNVGDTVLMESVGSSNAGNNPIRSKNPFHFIGSLGIDIYNAVTDRLSWRWRILPLASGAGLQVLQRPSVRAGEFHAGNWRGWMPYQNNYNYLGRPDLRHKTYVSGFSTEIVTKTANYTATESDHTILVDATAGAVTITLMGVVSNLLGPSGSINRSLGRELVIKKIDSSVNAVTIDANASETIDGATTQALAAQWDTLRIKCNGSAWYVI